MSDSFDFDASAAIFDRADLRTLRTSYTRALGTLEVSRIMDGEAKAELAKLVFHLGRDRVLEGTGLRYAGASEGIADEASAFLREAYGVALCA